MKFFKGLGEDYMGGDYYEDEKWLAEWKKIPVEMRERYMSMAQERKQFQYYLQALIIEMQHMNTFAGK